MAAKLAVVGQRYRDLGVTFPNADWVVEKIFQKADGFEYVELRSASDHTRQKMLSVSVVMDVRRFKLVE
jgi:hypothetical protein